MPEPTRCPECGAPLVPGDRFCGECGAALPADGAEAAAVPASAAGWPAAGRPPAPAHPSAPAAAAPVHAPPAPAPASDAAAAAAEPARRDAGWFATTRASTMFGTAVMTLLAALLLGAVGQVDPTDTLVLLAEFVGLFGLALLAAAVLRAIAGLFARG